MILKRKNGTAHTGNALQIPEVAGFCCGDVAVAAVCRYKTVIDTDAALTAASKIALGGTEYNFAQSIALGTDAGAKLLQEAIEAVLYQIGYTGDGVVVTQVGTDIVIETSFSQIVFNYLQVSGNAFRSIDCVQYGDFKADGAKADTKVGATVVGTVLTVKVGATVDVTNVAVSGTSVTTKSAAAPGGKLTTPTVLALDATTSLTVVVTYADATTASFTVPVTRYA